MERSSEGCWRSFCLASCWLRRLGEIELIQAEERIRCRGEKTLAANCYQTQPYRSRKVLYYDTIGN